VCNGFCPSKLLFPVCGVIPMPESFKISIQVIEQGEKVIYQTTIYMLCIDLNAGRIAFYRLPKTSFVRFTVISKIWPLSSMILCSMLNKVEKLLLSFQSLLGKIHAPYKSIH